MKEQTYSWESICLDRTFLRKAFGWVMLLALGSCVDPYRPPEVASPGSYLVVSGFINSAPGTTSTIQLSRTQNLTDTKAPAVETKAQVTMESSGKASYKLQEGANGTYTLSGVVPLSNETYRLRIRTAQGVEYLSDFVPVVNTPPIDSISWHVENEGVQINVNTHDPTDKTHYYRWDFNETWEYTAAFYSTLELINNRIIPRSEQVFQCWGSAIDKTILVSSSIRLSKDIISERPLIFIPGSSTKLGIRYSIQVNQYALTEEAYTYYDQLAKITQNVGSIFDPQPSQLTGNIHATANPNEPVMGFFRVGTVATSRRFINKFQLPPWLTIDGNRSCMIDTMTLSDIIQKQTAVISEYQRGLYFTSSYDCIDCRLRGGVTTKPAFWDQ